MLLGDRSGLDADTEESFRIAGTYHVLALSGAQVALVAGMLLWGMRWLGIGPALTGVLASLALGFYALIVGGDIPILRAVVTAATLLLGRALDLDADLPNLLGLAAGGILVERPSSILDVSFELSFAATLGILWLAPLLAARLPRLPWRFDLALAGSFAAQVVLYPFLAGYFHRLAPAALLLNLVAVPLAGAVLLAGALLLGVSTLWASLARRVGELAWILAHALLRSADVVRFFPWLDFRVPGPSIAASACYVAGLVMLLLSRGRARLGWASLACGVALILIPTTPRGDGRLHVTALDVGQGDAIVVRTPHGHTFVIDAGGGGQGRLDLGEAVVSPYLWSLGIRHIDGLVLSHPHPDHVGGVPALLRNFRVDAVFEGLAPVRDPVYRALDALLQETATVRLSVRRGFRANWDGVSVEALAPQPTALAPWTTHNDDSVVLLLGFGQITTMLAGDVERLGELRLPARHADLLKVPHHGSRTSSTPQLLAATLPRVAIVSAGYRNSFGHPHPEVVERYHRLGCQLLRTDRDGAITVSTDGVSLSIETFYDDSVPAAEWNTPPRGL
jgi:competence protein ComEC